ncbi:zinc-ribbon domain-containing protein [Gilliamella sp. wkB171]
MNDKVTWQCAKGHRWQRAASFIQLGRWCPYCAHKTYTIEDSFL